MKVSFISSRSFHLALSATLLTSIITSSPAQKVDKKKLDVAEHRASKAAKILTDISRLTPAEAIPAELIAQSRAIAVFPDADKPNMLVMKLMKGYGLISRRTSDGWSQPGFYGFAVIDRGWSKVKGDNPGIIMLFMSDEIIKGFEKDHAELVGVAGPVGGIPPEQEQKILGAGIIIYAFSENKLRGVSVDDDWSTQSGISADNHLNEAIYGMKGRDLFLGKLPPGREIPAALSAYHELLMTLPKQGS